MPRRPKFKLLKALNGLSNSLTVERGRGKNTGLLVDVIFLRDKSRRDRRGSVQSIYKRPNNRYLRVRRKK